MSSISLTVRLEPALQYLARNTANNHYLRRRFNVDESEIDSWLKTHNGGSRILTAARIQSVKEKEGALKISQVRSDIKITGNPPAAAASAREAAQLPEAEKTKITPVQPSTPPAPVAVKLGATSDLQGWLAAQRVVVKQAVNSYVVEVSPALAGSWLKFNVNNRVPSKSKIRRFQASMKAGKWMITGETVKFSVSGRLLDGQSRLLAIIQAGVTVPLEVRGGLPDVAQASMDCGELRRGSHTLEMMGEANVIALAAALKLAWLHEKGWLGVVPFGESRVIENREFAPLLERHQGIKASVGWVMESADKLKRVMQASEAAFFHYELGNACAETRDAFFEALIEGTGLTKVSPVWHLREWLLANRKDSLTKELRMERRAMILLAWNHCLAGDKVPALKWAKGDKFPAIAINRRAA
jgi:hypothetical protein